MNKGLYVIIGNKHMHAGEESYSKVVGCLGRIVVARSLQDYNYSLVRVGTEYYLIHKEDCFPPTENHHFTHLLQEKEDYV